MDKTRYLEISGRQLAGPDIQKETAQHRASSTAEKIEQRRRKKVCRTTKETFGAGKKKGLGDSPVVLWSPGFSRHKSQQVKKQCIFLLSPEVLKGLI